MGPIMSSRPLVRYTAALTNVVCNGDSLTSGQGASSSAMAYPKQMQLLSPINNQLVVTNTGIGGTNANTWINDHSAIDAAYVAGKVNVLTIDLGTNGVGFTNQSGIDEAVRIGTLCAALLAVHPDWKIGVCTTIPRGIGATQADRNSFNSALESLNAYLKANYKAMGAKILIDMRDPGSPFAFTDYLPETFNSTGLWASGESDTDRTHLNDSGYAAKAAIVAAAIRRMPLR